MQRGLRVDIELAFRVLRRSWWLVLGCMLAVTGAAGVMTVLTVPEYQAATRLFVSTTGSDTTSTALAGNQFSRERVSSYVELLVGNSIAERVIDSLDLDDTPSELSGRVAASSSPNTVLINLTVTDESPERARDIANAYATEFALMVGGLEASGEGSTPVKVTQVERPAVPAEAINPRPVRNLAGGAALGLLLGCAAGLLRERLDRTIRTAEQAQEITGRGIVGALVEDASLDGDHVLDSTSEFSGTAEAYRQFRTNLQFLDVDNPARTVVVTSSLPGDGKTTVAVNLALVLAQSGARVVLIEADMRRPRVTSYLGMISGAGLSSILAGRAQYSELYQPHEVGRLSVLAAGPMPPNPSEMLGSLQMRRLLAQLREDHDFIIIDAPPLLPVTDGAVLAKAADGALLVTRYGVTTRDQLAQAAGNLERIDARLLGVVLNRIPPKVATGYGYGYGYGASEPVHHPVQKARRPARRPSHRREAADPGTVGGQAAGF
jgi:capsular exopolysaccharide synthesis family protein